MFLLHCVLAENLWEEAIMCDVDIYYRVPLAKANKAGLRQSPLVLERLHEAILILDELRPIGCRGFGLIPIHRIPHRKRSEQVMCMGKEFDKIRGTWFHRPLLTP